MINFSLMEEQRTTVLGEKDDDSLTTSSLLRVPHVFLQTLLWLAADAVSPV